MKKNIAIILAIAVIVLILVVAVWGAFDTTLIPIFNLVLLAGLIGVTTVYAYSTIQQAAASAKMAQEMKEQSVIASRPVIIQTAIGGNHLGKGYSDEFEIYNAGNGPAIALEIILLDKDEKLFGTERRTFLRAGDQPTVLHPYHYNIIGHAGSTCYLLCRYQSIFSRSTKPSWYQTRLPFKPVLSQNGDYTYIESEELEFEEVFEKKSY